MFSGSSYAWILEQQIFVIGSGAQARSLLLNGNNRWNLKWTNDFQQHLHFKYYVNSHNIRFQRIEWAVTRRKQGLARPGWSFVSTGWMLLVPTVSSISVHRFIGLMFDVVSWPLTSSRIPSISKTERLNGLKRMRRPKKETVNKRSRFKIWDLVNNILLSNFCDWFTGL